MISIKHWFSVDEPEVKCLGVKAAASDEMRRGKEHLFDSKVKEFENRGMMGKKGTEINKFK